MDIFEDDHQESDSCPKHNQFHEDREGLLLLFEHNVVEDLSETFKTNLDSLPPLLNVQLRSALLINGDVYIAHFLAENLEDSLQLENGLRLELVDLREILDEALGLEGVEHGPKLEAVGLVDFVDELGEFVLDELQVHR